jgi:hypothetical protein
LLFGRLVGWLVGRWRLIPAVVSICLLSAFRPSGIRCCCLFVVIFFFFALRLRFGYFFLFFFLTRETLTSQVATTSISTHPPRRVLSRLHRLSKMNHPITSQDQERAKEEFGRIVADYISTRFRFAGLVLTVTWDYASHELHRECGAHDTKTTDCLTSLKLEDEKKALKEFVVRELVRMTHVTRCTALARINYVCRPLEEEPEPLDLQLTGLALVGPVHVRQEGGPILRTDIRTCALMSSQ